MSRALRIEYPGAFYHVINRGVERRTIFAEKADYQYFLSLVRDLYRRYRAGLVSYCLMPNHYHLFLNTPRGHLRSFMQELNSRYAQYYNKRCHRVGPVFQGRYKAVLVDKDNYALAIARYIHLNPVFARLANRPEDYEWSSYPALIGKCQGESYLRAKWLLGQFSADEEKGRKLLREFTEAGKGDGVEELPTEGGVVTGTEEFLRWTKREQVPKGRDGSVSRLKELQKPPAVVKGAIEQRVEGIVSDERLKRKMLMYALQRGTTLTAKEIAGLVGARSGSAVAQAVRRLRLEREANTELDSLMTKVDAVCRR